MVTGKPKIKDVIPEILKIVGDFIVVGHSINFDISMLQKEAKRCGIVNFPFYIKNIDTLRLARLYGECEINSLQKLREHFNIKPYGTHRAMGDVFINIEVFKNLVKKFKTTDQILKVLEKPIALRLMPLGRYKLRKFSEIPLDYLLWARHQNFDEDLIYSIQKEIKKRKKTTFNKATNPFNNL